MRVITELPDPSLPAAGYGEHDAYRQRFLHYALAGVEVPEVAVVDCAGRYGLGSVDRRSSAYAEEPVDAVLAAQGLCPS